MSARRGVRTRTRGARYQRGLFHQAFGQGCFVLEFNGAGLDLEDLDEHEILNAALAADLLGDVIDLTGDEILRAQLLAVGGQALRVIRGGLLAFDLGDQVGLVLVADHVGGRVIDQIGLEFRQQGVEGFANMLGGLVAHREDRDDRGVAAGGLAVPVAHEARAEHLVDILFIEAIDILAVKTQAHRVFVDVAHLGVAHVLRLGATDGQAEQADGGEDEQAGGDGGGFHRLVSKLGWGRGLSRGPVTKSVVYYVDHFKYLVYWQIEVAARASLSLAVHVGASKVAFRGVRRARCQNVQVGFDSTWRATTAREPLGTRGPALAPARQDRS